MPGFYEGKLPQVTGGLGTNGEEGITYCLTEAITPDGYDTMPPVTINIKAGTDEDGKLTDVKYTITDANWTGDGAKSGQEQTAAEGSDPYKNGLFTHTLKNLKAPILPHTGGVGALAVYGVSAAVLASGAALLIAGTKRRKGGAE